MDLSILIARMFSVIYLSVGVGILLNSTYYKTEFPKIIQNASLLYLSGFIATVFGVFVTSKHHYWEYDWRIVITIFGWIALIKGILLFVMPTFSKAFKNNILHPDNYRTVLVPILLVMGAFFGYFGFIH